MKPHGLNLFVSLTAIVAFTLPADAAMYKWVDEHGTTHYGDSVPPKYASRAAERSKLGAQAAKAEPAKASGVVVSEEDAERQKADAKRLLERQRQDTALLSTYANENEIELARTRELKRNQDILTLATAGLARSDKREDRQKLDALVDQSRRETDNINAKFDAQLARYRELKGPVAALPTGAQGHTATAK